VKVSASIMAHPDRATEAADLMSRLDHAVPVYWDGEGKPSGDANRIWRTARAAWLLHEPDADWHVLLQDDAMPCADLLAGLERALEHVPPDVVVSPYLGTGRNVPIRWEVMARTADTIGASWVRSAQLRWGVGIVLPVGLIPEMIEYADRRIGVPDDMRVAGWAERTQREVWYPWPSLIDHRQLPSLTKHRAPDRVARRHHHGSALDLTWSGPVVTDTVLARRQPARSGPSRLRSVRTGQRPGKAGNRA
jgi:hypothetical protein